MAYKRGLDGQKKDLKLGETFNKNYKDGAYHTIRYDFKPASVDKQKMGTVEVEENHQVTVTVPHVEGSTTSQTVYKGNHKPVAKECILIIDHVTGEIVLERISRTINVKTTRPDGSSRIPTQRLILESSSRRNSPPQKSSPSHPVSHGSTNTLSRPSPSHLAYPHARSPLPNKSPNNNHWTAPGSMPMLGLKKSDPVKEMRESSSDSDSNSSSSSSSDSDSEQDTMAKKTNGMNYIIDDLELSSVSEDSD
nr:ELL-associated factor 1-like [Procambarus clarkii]